MASVPAEAFPGDPAGRPSAAGAFFVEAVDGSGKAVELLGLGLSRGLALLDAFGREIGESGISPAELKIVLDLSSGQELANAI